MTTSFALKIAGAIFALLLGVYLGMGRFDQSLDEIDESLDERGSSKRVRRHFMFLDMGRKTVSRGSDLRRARRHFRTVQPDEKRTSRDGGDSARNRSTPSGPRSLGSHEED